MERWKELIDYKVHGIPLLSEAFFARWGERAWKPTDEDREAAAVLEMEISSRITSHGLGYSAGVEETALSSVYSLFGRTREICTKHPFAVHFSTIAWDVLNRHVRPFTAKWHRAAQTGALAALDATDEFRSELASLQPLLRCLDDLLLAIRDSERPPDRVADVSDPWWAEEITGVLRYGVPETGGGITTADATRMNAAEAEAIRRRRTHYQLPETVQAAGLALSGGGIRSATFSLGVLIALARRNLLPQFDYLSTVSGGGYLGSFISAFLASSPAADGIGLERSQLPFRRTEGEAAAIRHLRHHSKYLATGSTWQRLTMVFAQLLGMLLNAAAVLLVVLSAALLELLIRSAPVFDGLLEPFTWVSAAALVGGAVGAMALLRYGIRIQKHADALVAVPAVVLAALLCWRGLFLVHEWYGGLSVSFWKGSMLMAVLGSIPLIASAAFASWTPRRIAAQLLVVLSALSAPLFVFGLYLGVYHEARTTEITISPGREVPTLVVLSAAAVLGWVLYWFLLNVNATSPHRHYRAKLAKAYLIRPDDGSDANAFRSAVSTKLSDLSPPPRAGAPQPSNRAPYHLVNCALNVPGSKDAAMQGRLTDFFLFSPRFCGSPLLGYTTTESWERGDRHLDLATAMAISGAAAAPQMGLGTMPRLRFWLALLNVRLGYWVRKPGADSPQGRGAPGLVYLLREMLGSMHERRPWVHVSDGGHIENLGVYELLRRRCKYIVAVDGEQDAKMTFQGLTRLQRLAAIDLGVRIDIDLDDLRLNEGGLSRSHFRFCRIHYPERGDRRAGYGYLLYVKLSLTGNEGEFIRRFRADEPAFPHHSTADQFFSEEQFEAYRSLGEHTGNNLFLRAIVGDLADGREVGLEEWFARLGASFLEPVRSATSAE